VLSVGLLGAGYAYWVRELNAAQVKLPRLENFRRDLSTRSTEILSVDGQVLFTMAAEFREPIRITDVPQIVKDATLAAEDRRFYEHQGIDPIAVGRQMFTNVRERRIAGGASTLTMQLAKRLAGDDDKTFRRKIDDMALAVLIERRYTKDEILEMYLNQVFYGSQAYGIQAAADVYFGKSLKKLTVAEAALLSRCVRLPSRENPFANPERAVMNRNVVLRVMRDDGKIDQATLEKALDEPLRLKPRSRKGVSSNKVAPYFVDYVLDFIRRELPQVDFEQGGYRIETTINLKYQRAAEDAVEKLLREYRRSKVRTGAFLLMDRDGRILAMVGGGNYERNQFNMLTQGRRQPGSSFKPLVYAMAFERGALSPMDRLSNDRFTWTNPDSGEVWAPKNSSGRYGGMVTVQTAIAASLNMPAIRALERVGARPFVEYAHQVYGITSDLDPVLPLALGATALRPVELAQAYSVFMRLGDRVTPFGVTRVTAPDGGVVMEYLPNIRGNVMGRVSAESMDGLLRQVVVGTGGTARRAGVIVNARGKTGTTSDNRDAWFIGYTDQFLGLGWIANEVPGPRKVGWRYEPMSSRVFGGTVTIQMWTNVLRVAQKLSGEQPSKRSYSMKRAPVAPPTDATVVEDGTEDLPVADAGTAPPTETPRDETPAEAGTSNGNSPDSPESPTPREPTRKPPEQPTSPPKENESLSVSVTVCADSNELANASCPEQVVSSFRRGTEPKRRCHLHP